MQQEHVVNDCPCTPGFNTKQLAAAPQMRIIIAIVEADLFVHSDGDNEGVELSHCVTLPPTSV